MTYETKLQKNSGSMKTVIPAGLVKLLNLQAGNKIKWNVKISENNAEISITPIDE